MINPIAISLCIGTKIVISTPITDSSTTWHIVPTATATGLLAVVADKSWQLDVRRALGFVWILCKQGFGYFGIFSEIPECTE